MFFFILEDIDIDISIPTIIHKNNETNDKFYRKIAFLTEMVKGYVMEGETSEGETSGALTAANQKPHRGLGTRLPSDNGHIMKLS